MPEIIFTIDPTAGKLEMHVVGIAGPACEDIAKLAKQLLGAPAQEEQTAEYRLRPGIRPVIRRKANP